MPTAATIEMSVRSTHVALLVLVGFTPLLAFFDGLVVDNIVSLAVAVVLLMVAFAMRPGEGAHLIKTARWAAALAALPALWLVVQLLPVPLSAVSKSIWESAAAALGAPLPSRTTIDPGLTLLALSRYASMIAVGCIAAATSIDREPAERLLYALGAATIVLSLISIAHHLGGLAFLDGNAAASVWSAAELGGIYGVTLFVAIVILILERHFTRQTSQGYLVALFGGGAGLAICAWATAMTGSEHATFAAGCAAATVVIIYFVRRIGLAGSAALVLAGVTAAGAVALVWTKARPVPADFSLRYAAHPSADFISVIDRIVGEVGFGGSGGGTFRAIYRIYAPQELLNAGSGAPTSAAQIAIEMGRPALWVIVASLAAVIFLYASGGFSRGRDFFYPIAGAGVGVATLVFAFCDTGVGNLAISILLAATLGLALVQSASRSL